MYLLVYSFENHYYNLNQIVGQFFKLCICLCYRRKELLPGSVLVSDKKFGKDYWLDLLAAQGKAEQDH